MSTNSNEAVVNALSALLADTFTLYMKTHGYHWNVTGPMFTALHDLFEEQYTEEWQAIDQLAERIRILGSAAPGSASALGRGSSIGEETGQPDAMEMVRTLVADNMAVAASARRLAEVAAEAGDVATEDLGVARVEIHEKNAWFLRSHLE